MNVAHLSWDNNVAMPTQLGSGQPTGSTSWLSGFHFYQNSNMLLFLLAFTPKWNLLEEEHFWLSLI